MSLRNERVRKTLMKEIADIIQREVRDPRITGVVSIVDVEMSQDNSYAKVIYSVFSTDEEAKAKTIEALNANKPHIRFELGKRIRLRHTPDLRFIASARKPLQASKLQGGRVPRLSWLRPSGGKTSLPIRLWFELYNLQVQQLQGYAFGR